VKGITPVIAIILLLMITIALIGFAFVWFTSVTGTLANQTGTQLTEKQRQMATAAKIDNIDTANGEVTIRNIGTVDLDLSEVEVYADGKKVDCDWGGTTVVPARGTATCKEQGGEEKIKNCNSIEITTIGQGDTRSC